MIYGSLFSGIGGLDAGLHRAGHRAAFLCDSLGNLASVAHACVCHAAKGGDPTTDNYVAGPLGGGNYGSGRDGTNTHPNLVKGVRRLTPTECERLQGLPDGWTLPGSDSKRYAGLGDAVTANVAEWIGRRLAA